MAELKDQIRDDLKTAMKARDKQVTTVLRSVLATIGTEEVSGDAPRELTGDEELAIIRSEVKKRREAAEGFTAGGRTESAESELAEAKILGRYLPAALSEDELDALVAAEVSAAAAELGEQPGMKQMGQIVRAVNEKAHGRAEGKVVAAKVRAALQ
ncbi:GatB/YqeY domain-containing protein [Naumannella halotolerans]|uniref:Glutamyl-tRNA amidotransferase n=1 Tax=Naumannella halotolerans TaxID=993414 RepID=A0A4R7J0T4_9ACTN|nr:GatB/YqeY domain-containing protein [Naumannella halotolerans]TDT29917.1 hypothetical protein CLV29_2940 [Naumannella halotolerans]